MATSNNISKVMLPLQSRFFVVNLEPYTYEQFYQITVADFVKDIIEVNRAGERYIITIFSGGIKQYEHWKCYQQQMFTKVLHNIFDGADNYI